MATRIFEPLGMTDNRVCGRYRRSAHVVLRPER
jgi:hypothetical protein